MRFANRRDAGRRLAERLGQLALHDPLILALPRGGVPVGYEIAVTLQAPLDVFVARKIGAPGRAELGIAAIAEGRTEPVATELVARLGLNQSDLAQLARREQARVARRVTLYRDDRPLPTVAGHDVVVVDDGLATGVTAEAALRSLRPRRPRRLVLAVPVCAGETAERIRGAADELVCLHAPHAMHAVGMWYDDFTQTTDREVLDLLADSRRRYRPSPAIRHP